MTEWPNGLSQYCGLYFDRHLAIADRICRLRGDQRLAVLEDEREVFANRRLQRSTIALSGAHRRGQIVLEVQPQADFAVAEDLRLGVDVQRHVADAGNSVCVLMKPDN